MNTALIRTASVAVSLVAALALTGCGGGGGGGTAMAPADAAPTVTSGGGGGGGPRPAAPVTTIAESLASSRYNQFTPLTAAMRDRVGRPIRRRLALTDDFRVTSISSDGANGWQVTIRPGWGRDDDPLRGTELLPTEPAATRARFYSETDDGDEFSSSGASTEIQRWIVGIASQRFRYFDQSMIRTSNVSGQ